MRSFWLRRSTAAGVEDAGTCTANQNRRIERPPLTTNTAHRIQYRSLPIIEHTHSDTIRDDDVPPGSRYIVEQSLVVQDQPKKLHSPFANRTNGQTPCGSMQTNQPLGHAQNNPTCVSILSSPIRARGLQPHRSPAAQHPFLLRYRRDMHEALDATREGSAGAVLWWKKPGEPLESGVLKAYFCSCVFDARGHLITIPRSFASGYYLRAALPPGN